MVAATSLTENCIVNNTGTVLAFPVRVTGLELDTDSIILPEKSIKKFTASVLPENAMEQGIHYTSDDNKVASVTEDGVIIRR